MSKTWPRAVHAQSHFTIRRKIASPKPLRCNRTVVPESFRNHEWCPRRATNPYRKHNRNRTAQSHLTNLFEEGKPIQNSEPSQAKKARHGRTRYATCSYLRTGCDQVYLHISTASALMYLYRRRNERPLIYTNPLREGRPRESTLTVVQPWRTRAGCRYIDTNRVSRKRKRVLLVSSTAAYIQENAPGH